MVFVPLIPKPQECENFDVAHILQEVFQDFIDPDEFYQNVTKNVLKYKLENANLRKTSEKVLDAYDETKLSMDDITHTEGKLMVSQGKYLMEDNALDANIALLEAERLSNKPIFEEISSNDIKHELLQVKDIHPSKLERSMDFSMNSNRHRCEPPCESKSEIVEKVYEKETCVHHLRKIANRIDFIYFDKQYHQYYFQSLGWTVNMSAIKNPQNNEDRSLQAQTQKLEIFFLAEPSEIEFPDYQVGIKYEKFGVKVDQKSGTTRVAAGMCVVFSVKYHPEIYKDVEDKVTINTFNGEDVVVTLKSYRTPPKLIAFIHRNSEHFIANNQTGCECLIEYSEERQLALNSSIDCGGCLVGSKVNINVLIKNKGSDGKFFILSEDEWYFSEVTFCQPDGELVLGSFSIQPAYFQIKKDDLVELLVTFSSIEFGLAVEKLFLLCDNNTVEELEIIADGVLFDRSSVVIDPLFASRGCGVESFDATCGFVVNFNNCLPGYEYVRFLTVHNNSCISFKYKLTIRDTISLGLNKLDSNWLIIKNPPLYLYGNSTTQFELVLSLPDDLLGIYSTVLILHVVDIPETSLTEDGNFCVLEKSEDGEVQVYDVVVGEVEIIANYETINIIFNPSVIEITDMAEIDSSVKQKIEFTAQVQCELKGEWTVSNSKILEVYPSEITLLPNIVNTCELRIHIIRHEDVKETITFRINDSLYSRVFDVCVRVVKPKIEFTINTINFGTVYKGQVVPPKQIGIKNTGFGQVQWLILECYYDFKEKRMTYCDTLNHLSANTGFLCAGETRLLDYTIEPLREECTWISFLIVISIYPTQMAMDSVCLITCEVSEPNIKIHTGLSQYPLIVPGKLLYLGCKTQYNLCVHNFSKRLSGSFAFGSPEGKQADDIDITFKPKSGVVCPNSCVHVIMSIVPLEVGVIGDVEVLCHIKYCDVPIRMAFMCVVDNIHLNYYLPTANENDPFVKVFWPPHIVPPSPKGLLEEMENEEESTKTEMKASMESIDESKESLDFASLESCPGEESTETKLSSSSAKSQSSLRNLFTEDVQFYEHAIEFRDIPLRTPVKKTIILENVTPILGDYCFFSTNFQPICPEDTKKRLFSQMLENINMKPKSDEWENFINTKYGIMVKFNPPFGCVSCLETVEVDLWVYANTWGVYIEEAIICINDIQPFTFNLLIEVVGIPIEYPILLNSLVTIPTLKFGPVPYLGESKSRILRIRNFSCIPVHIVWHTFLLDGHPTKFNLIMESFDQSSTNSSNETEMSMKMLITKKYHGIQQSSVFQVTPISIRLKPKAIKDIRLRFHPKSIGPKFKRTELQGVLIGYIHLSHKYKFQSNVFIRKTDVNVTPAQVNLVGIVELPLLDLNLVQGDLKFAAYADDVIKAREIRYERNLIFQNNHEAIAEVTMNINTPFKVVNLKTVHAKTEKNYLSASVPCGYCLHALIECVMDSEQVLRYSDMLFNTKASIFPEDVDFDDNSVVIKRNLEIHQDGVASQVLPMEFKIYYPVFEVSDKTITFGIVFIGNTRRSLLTLFNTTGNAIPFTVHKPPFVEEFNIIPARGTIPKSNGRIATSISLNVYFTPR
ncbi:hypothetical protein FQR65_LT10247 [Abscondita terminalis]|nr:hypothetical protein FQR65_LT10247 [Abscondita terminalis]